ncbi:MAG: nucleotidyltransferase family protein [Gaiellales bacterium]
MSRIAAVVLAAGEASRFGGPKQRLTLPAVLGALRQSGAVEEIVVVEGAHPLDEMGPDTRVVRNDDWELGPGASLRAGLAALGEDVDAVMVILADGPDLAPGAIAVVRASWEQEGGDVVAASYGGARGHPLVLARPAWGSVPDEGLRSLPVRLVPCDAFDAPGDVDYPADLPERLR